MNYFIDGTLHGIELLPNTWDGETRRCRYMPTEGREMEEVYRRIATYRDGAAVYKLESVVDVTP